MKLEKAELNHDDSREADKLMAGLKKLIGLLKPAVAHHEQNMMADDEDWRDRSPELTGTDRKPASPCPIGRADPSELSALLGRAASAGERCSQWLAFISLILIVWACVVAPERIHLVHAFPAPMKQPRESRSHLEVAANTAEDTMPLTVKARE